MSAVTVTGVIKVEKKKRQALHFSDEEDDDDVDDDQGGMFIRESSRQLMKCVVKTLG